LEGKQSLEQAVAFARQQDFMEAGAAALRSEAGFETSLGHLEVIRKGIITSRLPLVRDELDNAANLVHAAYQLSRGIGQGSNSR
jgi:hypothetical protein